MLRQRFGKSGVQLHAYANGYDPAPVHRVEDLPPPKSIGNSATAPRDLICEADARAALLSLSESVGARLRLEGYQCRTVVLSVRTADLRWCSHRMALRHPTDLTSEVLDAALALCEQAHLWPEPLRSIGVRRRWISACVCAASDGPVRGRGAPRTRAPARYHARQSPRPLRQDLCPARPRLL